jgi:hypothetical protein
LRVEFGEGVGELVEAAAQGAHVVGTIEVTGRLGDVHPDDTQLSELPLVALSK